MIQNTFKTEIDKISLVIKFSWAEILFYGFFITYGFFGAMTPSYINFVSNISVGIFQIIMLSFFLLLLGIIEWKWGKNYADQVVLSGRDLLALTIIFLLLFGLGYKSLGQSLQGDESAYLIIAFGHAIKILLKFEDYLVPLSTLPAKYLIQFVSLLILVGLIFFVYASRKLAWPIKIGAVLSVMLICRILIIFLGGNPSPHPPLTGATHLIFGAIFGINDFALKSAFFVVYVLFIFGIYKMANRVMPCYMSLLFALSSGTIALSLHLAAIVESSVWSLICFTLVMLELVTNKSPNFIRLACFVSLMTLLRQPSFIAYIPVLIMFAVLFRKSYLTNFKNTLLAIFTPSIFFVPFLIQSIVNGTPSTVALGNGISQLDRVLQALASGIVIVAIANSVSKLWILFMPFAFFNGKKYWVNGLAFFSFFVVALLMYYAISPGLYGLGKYQAEYAVPFAIVGSYIVTEKLASVFNKKVLTCLLCLIILFNIIEYNKIPSVNKPVDELVDTIGYAATTYDSGYHILSGFPYEFGQAYNEIKALGLTNNAYTVGVTYGVFLEIVNGYSLEAVRKAESIFRLQRKFNEETNYDLSGPVIVANIEKDPRIKAVMLGAVSQKDELIDEFIRYGWIKHGTYKNVEYGSSVTVMKRILD